MYECNNKKSVVRDDPSHSQVKAPAPISEEEEIGSGVQLQPVNFAVVAHRARGVRDQVLNKPSFDERKRDTHHT